VWDSWLEGKLDLELAGGQQGKQQQQEDQDQDDAGSGGGGGGVVGVRGALRLKVLRLNVTQQQDVQLSVGVDYARSHTSSNSRGGRTAGDSSSGSLVSVLLGGGGVMGEYCGRSECEAVVVSRRPLEDVWGGWL
jgi:hypothetical protein